MVKMFIKPVALVSQLLKYGHTWVTLSHGRKKKPGQMIRWLCVLVQGHGMPFNYVWRFFEALYQEISIVQICYTRKKGCNKGISKGIGPMIKKKQTKLLS